MKVSCCVFHFRSETDGMTKIVDTIDSELDVKLVSTPAHLTGMVIRTEYINSWLKYEQSDAQILAICGMGGNGKTTLSKYIYNSHKQNFESSSFLEEIGKHNEQSYGLLSLQKQLVTDILGEKTERIPGVSEGTVKIKKALKLKRVLIVLDDIDDKDEISTLLGTKAFHTQSKIIITTRLLDVNAWFGSLSWRCHMHEVELLNDDESLKLLSWHAFGSNTPIEGFEDLAIELTRYCGGNPLAIKVLGSSLFVSAEDSEKRISMIEIWKSKLNFLNSQKGNLYSNIQRILQKSFDSLPCTSYKELFLHIAIFFVGEDEDYLVNILEHDWHAKAGIKTLINRCLLTVSPSKKLMMHQLLKDMGKNIVREESKDTAKHTRVWLSDEAYHLLTKGDGSETIKGLALDARKLKKGTKVRKRVY
ncbi:TMV resistance protein N-like protein [Tanacetum coccineum]